MNCTDFLETGLYNVEYQGKPVGITLDTPRLDIIPELYEAKCYYIKGKAVRKIITNMKYTILTKIKKTDKNFAELPQGNKENSKIIFAENVLATGGELCLTPVTGKRNISYRFPKALLVPEAACLREKAENSYLELKFEVYEDSEGVLVHKIS